MEDCPLLPSKTTLVAAVLPHLEGTRRSEDREWIQYQMLRDIVWPSSFTWIQWIRVSIKNKGFVKFGFKDFNTWTNCLVAVIVVTFFI